MWALDHHVHGRRAGHRGHPAVTSKYAGRRIVPSATIWAAERNGLPKLDTDPPSTPISALVSRQSPELGELAVLFDEPVLRAHD
jgi:hypothetical protein